MGFKISSHRKLYLIETLIADNEPVIESWFQDRWRTIKPPFMSSVDLRHAGFKVAPVDTNLFPAGFNNLDAESLFLCVQALKNAKMTQKNILLLPENHTRNRFYLHNIAVLRDLFLQAGFNVRIGSLDASLTEPVVLLDARCEKIFIEPLLRVDGRVVLADFNPDLLILNNDLSSGIPAILRGVLQPIMPALDMGWATRRKSQHFQYFSTVAFEFAALLAADPWLFTPIFSTVDGVDFMAQTGLEALALAVDAVLLKIQQKYAEFSIKQAPFVVVKADNGTYGMSVMMVGSGAQILQLNRKERTKMAAIKGGETVSRLLIQEGVYSVETMSNGAVAEPVIYMIGANVVGGFYRAHSEKAYNQNLNAPGMYFVPISTSSVVRDDVWKRFYVYSTVARLAALAAACEIAALGGNT